MINRFCLPSLELKIHEHINQLLLLIDSDAQRIFKKHNAFIAGGALTTCILTPNNKEQCVINPQYSFNDIDIYFLDKSSLNNCLRELETCFGFKGKRSKYAININSYVIATHQVQLIRHPKLLGDPNTIINKFDFSINQIAYDFANDSIFFTGDFILDIIKKELRINPNLLSPLSTLIRTNKYINKGFTFPQKEQLKLAFIISKLKFNNMGEALSEIKESIYGIGFKKNLEEYKHIEYTPENLVKILDCLLYAPDQFIGSRTVPF